MSWYSGKWWWLLTPVNKNNLTQSWQANVNMSVFFSARSISDGSGYFLPTLDMMKNMSMHMGVCNLMPTYFWCIELCIYIYYRMDISIICRHSILVGYTLFLFSSENFDRLILFHWQASPNNNHNWLFRSIRQVTILPPKLNPFFWLTFFSCSLITL